MHFSLRWKIPLLAVAAPLVLGLCALSLVERNVSDNVRSNIEETLESSARVCDRVLVERSKMLQASAQIIVKDPRFFAALSLPISADAGHFRATVQGVSRDFHKISRTDIFEVLDLRGHRVASVGPVATTTERRRDLVESVRLGRPATGVLLENGEHFQVVIAPVHAGGRNLGTLLLGSRIGDGIANELRQLTRSEITFVSGQEVTGSTLQLSDDRNALQEELRSRSHTSGDILHAGIVEIHTQDESFLTLIRTMPGADQENLIVVQRSLDEETAFLSEIQRRLGELGLLILVAALIVSLIVSRKITRPIMKLVRGAEEMEKSNYDFPLDVRSHDEIGYLAERFDNMRGHEREFIKNLEEVARVKSEFIDVAAHELRTPVTVIQGYSELLSQGGFGPITEEQRQALKAIDHHLAGIVRIAEDATWMAQLHDQQPILNPDDHDIRSLLEDAVGRATTDVVNRSHRISVEVEPENCRGNVDGPRLTHAIAHLIRNAIRFTPDDGIIRVGAHRDDDGLILTIQDNGIGITEEKKAHLFDPVLNVSDSLHHHSSRTLEFRSVGLGLGLPIAQGIVTAHGGSIAVESRPGEGSTFTIALPQAAAPGRRQVA